MESSFTTILMNGRNKQRWSNIPPISTNRTITFQLKSLNINKTTTYGVVNPGSGLGQSQKCDGVKPINVKM